MYPRSNYEMTEADLAALLDACKPVPLMMIGGIVPRSQQECANAAWSSLGRKMGFDHMTVQPVSGKGERFFTAVPTETEKQRAAREAREATEARKANIERLTKEISDRQKRLLNLQREEDAGSVRAS